MFGFHGDEGDPAEFEPGTCFGLDDLGVLTARANARGAIAFLFDLGGASEDEGDEEAEVLFWGWIGKTKRGCSRMKEGG